MMKSVMSRKKAINLEGSFWTIKISLTRVRLCQSRKKPEVEWKISTRVNCLCLDWERLPYQKNRPRKRERREERTKKRKRLLPPISKRKKPRRKNLKSKKNIIRLSKFSLHTGSKTCYPKWKCLEVSNYKKRRKAVSLVICCKWTKLVQFVRKDSSSWSRTCRARCRSSTKFSKITRSIATRKRNDCYPLHYHHRLLIICIDL